MWLKKVALRQTSLYKRPRPYKLYSILVPNPIAPTWSKLPQLHCLLFSYPLTLHIYPSLPLLHPVPSYLPHSYPTLCPHTCPISYLTPSVHFLTFPIRHSPHSFPASFLPSSCLPASSNIKHPFIAALISILSKEIFENQSRYFVIRQQYRQNHRQIIGLSKQKILTLL